MSLLVRPEKSTPVAAAAIAELFTKNDTLMEDSERSGKLNFLSECYLKRYKNSLDEVVKLAEQSYN